MPILPDSAYRAPKWFSNNHVQTIYHALVRQVKGVDYLRERVELPDGDFLDLDIATVGAKRAVILMHGLEGSSYSSYMLGTAKAFNRRGWDVIAMNQRSCSGEINRLARCYHGGETEDLEWVLLRILEKQKYDRISLIGFSLGGNIMLKYLGEKGTNLPSELQNAAAVSVPCDLPSAYDRLLTSANGVYHFDFLRRMKSKLKAKLKAYPGLLGLTQDAVDKIKTLEEFDAAYTVPIHGYKSVTQFQEANSAKLFIPEIRLPTMLLMAKDDPFFPEKCYPMDLAKDSDYFFLETSEQGGHVGFVEFNEEEEYWYEKRLARWLEKFI